MKLTKEDIRDLCILVLAIFVMATIAAFSTKAFAFDADIYGGYYIDSTMRSSPLANDREAEWVAGMKMGHDIDKWRLFYGVETLMDQYNGDGSFHPASIKYNAGITYDLSAIHKGLTITGEHMCWHPIDGAGRTEQYNLIKINYHFGGK